MKQSVGVKEPIGLSYLNPYQNETPMANLPHRVGGWSGFSHLRINIKFAMKQARSHAKIPEGAKLFAMKSTRQGSNDGELLHPKYIGCKVKRHRVQWDGGAIDGANAPAWLRAWVQHNFRRTQLPPSTEEKISSLALTLRYSITSGARCWCYLGGEYL